MSRAESDPPAERRSGEVGQDAGPGRPPAGVTLRIHAFGLADKELTDVLTPPWPQWMLRLYELEAMQHAHVDVAGGEVGLSAALGALKERLSRRLDTLAWVCSALESAEGWELSVHGPDIFAYSAASADQVRRFLEDSRLAAVLPQLCEIDDDGLPQLYGGRPPGERLSG